jgi:hypothetical protein
MAMTTPTLSSPRSEDSAQSEVSDSQYAFETKRTFELLGHDEDPLRKNMDILKEASQKQLAKLQRLTSPYLECAGDYLLRLAHGQDPHYVEWKTNNNDTTRNVENTNSAIISTTGSTNTSGASASASTTRKQRRRVVVRKHIPGRENPDLRKQRLMRVTFEKTVFEKIVEEEIKIAERTRAAAEAQSIALATDGKVFLIPVQTITTTTEGPAPSGRHEHATASMHSKAPSTTPSGHDPETPIVLYTSSRDQVTFLDSDYDFDYDHIASGDTGLITVRQENISPEEEARSDVEYAGEASRDELCEEREERVDQNGDPVPIDLTTVDSSMLDYNMGNVGEFLESPYMKQPSVTRERREPELVDDPVNAAMAIMSIMSGEREKTSYHGYSSNGDTSIDSSTASQSDNLKNTQYAHSRKQRIASNSQRYHTGGGGYECAFESSFSDNSVGGHPAPPPRYTAACNRQKSSGYTQQTSHSAIKPRQRPGMMTSLRPRLRPRPSQYSESSIYVE